MAEAREREIKMKIIKAVFIAISFSGLSFISAHADEENKMMVFKNPSCGCCKVWTDAVEEAGYKVTIQNLEDMSQIKKQAHVTKKLEACHTAVIGGYVLEGHVPLEAIKKLLAKNPKIRGIAVPGMPTGSLGMGYDPRAKYNVYAFVRDSHVPPQIFFKAGGN
jgi:hypothetical protein